jgi:hypothetical protein
VNVLLSDGSGSVPDGTLGARTTYAVGAVPQGVVAADLNGDGKMDLATANSTGGTVSILLGNGAGGFAAAVDFPTGGTQPTGIAAGDLDQEGDVDLAVPHSQGGTVAVLLGDGTGKFAAPLLYPAGNSLRGIAIADVNRDGRLDLATIVSQQTGFLRVLTRNGCVAP